MKRLILLSAMFSSASVLATSGGANSGASLTTGPSSNPYSMSASFHNPAMGALSVRKGEKWRVSLFPTFNGNVEYGQVDGFIDDLEELADLLDDPTSAGDNETPDEILSRFNDEVLPKVGEQGYMKISGSMNAPLAPLYFYSDTLKGTVGLDVSISGVGGISVLEDDLGFNDQNGTFSTGTAIYLKSGIETSIAASYSRKAYQNNYGTLYAGAKLKFMNLALSKQIIPLVQLAGSDLGDLIVDEFEKNQVSSSGFGVDLGMVWDSNRYRVGFTIENINSPEFEYGALGEDCHLIAEQTPERTNCNAAYDLVEGKGVIKGKETHIKDASMRVDGLVNLTERLQVSGSYDLTVYNDAIGYQHQWMHAAISYDSDYFLLPSLRVGYQENLAGTKTSSFMFGTTFFKIVSADLEIGLDNVSIDGTEVPRRFGFALSVQESF